MVRLFSPDLFAVKPSVVVRVRLESTNDVIFVGQSDSAPVLVPRWVPRGFFYIIVELYSRPAYSYAVQVILMSASLYCLAHNALMKTHPPGPSVARSAAFRQFCCGRATCLFGRLLLLLLDVSCFQPYGFRWGPRLTHAPPQWPLAIK